MDQNNTEGQEMPSMNQAPQQEANTQASAQGASGADQQKLFAILGYFLPFLFFIPLMLDSTKNEPFARFHANQQLILLCIGVGLKLIGIVFLMMMPLLYTLIPLLYVVYLVLAIMGIINAAQGTMKELPVVGSYKILK